MGQVVINKRGHHRFPDVPRRRGGMAVEFARQTADNPLGEAGNGFWITDPSVPAGGADGGGELVG